MWGGGVLTDKGLSQQGLSRRLLWVRSGQGRSWSCGGQLGVSESLSSWGTGAGDPSTNVNLGTAFKQVEGAAESFSGI